MLNDWTSTKSYANQANLEKALIKLNLIGYVFLTVQIPGTNRLTAVFPKSHLGNNFMVPVYNGFKVLG
jgi:hypothetical protein